MAVAPPARVGMALADVDTPVLIVDLDAFERNLRRMRDALDGSGVRLRPHAKTHKCAVIALEQMALGAVGACCQKVSEAEALVQAGVPDVLVSNEVVGAIKLQRLAALARRARVGVCVDDAGNVDELARAAAAAGARIDVLVEIDVGAGRCGVAPGDPAVALARRVAAYPALRFAGLQAYQGRAQHVRDFDERRAAIEAAVALAADTVQRLGTAGLPCDTVAGAGAGSFRFELASGVYNELQPGSYVFMDADYARNLGAGGDRGSEFEQSLHVWAMVMSRPESKRVIVDAGLKAMAFDSGPPEVPDVPGATFLRASDEHGSIVFEDAGHNALALGAKLRLVPGHCDPTVNLHDWLVGVRGERVEALWPVVARGALT